MAKPQKFQSIWEDAEESLHEALLCMPTDEIVRRTRLMDNEIKMMESELERITHELQRKKEKIKHNSETIRALPRLGANVIELFDVGKSMNSFLCAAQVESDL